MDQQPEIINEINNFQARSEAERRKLRFAFNCEKLARGEFGTLKSYEFVEGLQETLQVDADAYSRKELSILKNLGQGLIAEDPAIREKCLALLAPVTELSFAAASGESRRILSPALCAWLEYETAVLPGYEVMVRKIERLAQWFFDNECRYEALPLTEMISRIVTGGVEKKPAIRSLAGQVLANLCKKTVLSRLTDDFLHDDQARHEIRNLLLAFGEKAALYLLGRVIVSQNRAERIALLDLIPVFKNQAMPVLSECLENRPPWYVIRNIIYIIGQIGCDENYSLVERYLNHRDERVQYEMICCVLKLGGCSMTARLTAALLAVNIRHKVHVIRLLEQHSTKNEGFYAALCKLAENDHNFCHISACDLVRGLTAALKNFPCRHTIQVLEKLQLKCSELAEREQLVLLIDEAIHCIKPMIRHNFQEKECRRETVSYDLDPAKKQQALTKMQKIEPQLAKHIGSGAMERVGGLIQKQVAAALDEGDFIFAELLRDRLLEIDPMAFYQAIELGELIENRKSGSSDEHHLKIWSELYEHLSTEEFNILSSVLREEYYNKGESIVNSGDTDNKLFFFSSGHASLGCMVGGKDIFLKRMQPGDILGCQQFFSASVWTVNLRALSAVKVQVLGLEALAEIIIDYPNIDKGLRQYCRKYGDIAGLLLMSGDDRREFPRFSGSLRIRTTLVDAYGSRGRRGYKGDLVDISRGGLAFVIRISSKNNARLLLGRQVVTDLILDGEVVTCKGIIVGVRPHDDDGQTYFVHVKFAKHFEQKRFGRIVSLLK